MDRFTAIQCFLAVAEQGSFTQAGEKLGLSKTVVSKGVASIEKQLGVRLLERTTRHCALTEAGRHYQLRAGEILEEMEDLENQVMHLHKAPEGKIRLTVPPIFGEIYLTPILGEFLKKYPGIELDVVLGARFTDLVEEGFDAGVRVASSVDGSLAFKRLADMPLLTVASCSYLKNREAPKVPADLLTHDCLTDTNARDGGWRFQVGKTITQIPVKSRFRVGSALAIRTLVLAGYGIGQCPAFAVAEDLRAKDLTVLLEEYQLPPQGVFLIYPHRRNLSGRLKALGNFLMEAFSGPLPSWGS